MIKLEASLKAWGTDQFKPMLRNEISALDETNLPLQEGLSRANFVDASDLSVLVLNIAETDALIQVKTGIFYEGIIAGCNCSDDPSPMPSHTEYCVIRFEINKQTAETNVLLIE
ncbi:MAG: hypothetical protein KAH00_01785 [Cocleimonas sp.]|nr:hypothetical protein [Cocleimonas sp.]